MEKTTHWEIFRDEKYEYGTVVFFPWIGNIVNDGMGRGLMSSPDGKKDKGYKSTA